MKSPAAPAEDNISHDPVDGRAPLILGGHDFHSITEAVAAPLEAKPPLGWWIVLAASGSLLGRSNFHRCPFSLVHIERSVSLILVRRYFGGLDICLFR